MSNLPISSTYNKVAAKYTDLYFSDLSDSWFVDQFIENLPNKGKVLDVGCGPGTWVKYLTDKGYDVEGIDTSSEMIKITKEKVPNGIFKLMDMSQLDYSDASFDGILAMYSLIHIPSNKISQTLAGFNKVLHPGGILALVVQQGNPDQIIPEPLDKSEEVFVNFYNLPQIVEDLNKSGFKIVSQKQMPYDDPENLSDTLIYLIAKKI